MKNMRSIILLASAWRFIAFCTIEKCFALVWFFCTLTITKTLCV
jgi:hypothetical protein